MKVAVIFNDMSEVNVDARLVENEHTLSRTDEGWQNVKRLMLAVMINVYVLVVGSIMALAVICTCVDWIGKKERRKVCGH